MLQIFFFKNHADADVSRLVTEIFLFLKRVYMWQVQVVYILITLYFNCPPLRNTIKTNSVKLYTITREICSIQKRIWDQCLHHILCMIFQEKCFSGYILLTDQISPSDCFNFWRYLQYVNCNYLFLTLLCHKLCCIVFKCLKSFHL